MGSHAPFKDFFKCITSYELEILAHYTQSQKRTMDRWHIFIVNYKKQAITFYCQTMINVSSTNHHEELSSYQNSESTNEAAQILQEADFTTAARMKPHSWGHILGKLRQGEVQIIYT